MSVSELVKTFAELNGAALASGHDRELLLWLLLRALDVGGCARVKLADVEAAISERGLFRWGGKPMEAARLRQWLRRGQGVFWDIDAAQGKVVYRSLRRVCQALGVLTYRKPVAVPLEALGTLATARAYLHAAVLTKEGGAVQVSRARLTALTGASTETQRRRERASGVTSQRHISRQPWTRERGRELRAGGFLVTDARGRVWEFARIANSYSTSLEVLASGQVRKVRTAVKRGLIVGEAVRNVQRVYFRSGYEAAKSKSRASRFYIDTGQRWHGFGLWDAYGQA